MSYDLICMIYTLIYVAASIVVSLLIGRVIRTEIDQKMQDHDDNMDDDGGVEMTDLYHKAGAVAQARFREN